ncbi:MAG: (2Fe-2S)-binding protein, partial [Lachnospiraceae bacterium]|nr:(2Fe-2S)-binding protein [Lachnospiraceae bacterium]
MNILEYLRKQNVTIQAPCGGNGTCGKCLVSVDGGEPVRACRTEYRQGMRIEPVSVLNDIFVPGMDQTGLSDEKTDADPDNSVDIKSHPERTNLKTAIAIDIGTTTIVAALCETGSGRIIAQESVVNPNAIFGADVISRIKAGSEGHGAEMSERLRGSLIDLAGKLYESAVTGDTILNDIVSSSDNEDNGRNASDGQNKTRAIEQADVIVIAGNTTMIHTLMDYDLKPLGTFPYEPVNIGIIKGSAGELLGIKTSGLIFATHMARCVIFPGASAFVGGDIISGLFSLDEDSPVKKT